MVYNNYSKLICYQDIERTPSLSIYAIRDFFKVFIENGQSTFIDLIIKGKKYSVELNKRNTRNEYRFFLNRYRNEINYEIDDIMIFRRNGNNIELNIVKKRTLHDSKSKYSLELSKLGGKYHLLSKY